MHRVVLPDAIPDDAAAAEERLVQLVRDALTGKGFEEMAGSPHIWRKRGVTVQTYLDNSGELVLKVRAFGSKRDVRASERAEQELLAALKEHARLSISVISPASPSE